MPPAITIFDPFTVWSQQNQLITIKPAIALDITGWASPAPNLLFIRFLFGLLIILVDVYTQHMYIDCYYL